MLPDGVAPTAANLGAAVAALYRELGLDRPHLAGNSLGAWAALEIAKAGGAASRLLHLARRAVAQAARAAPLRLAPSRTCG